ncbi:uncharacterized protein LOC128236597 [Mya arenaria]|uniref:uncharacterized protein LOC128236597 n=1 Tax=Mya arenaria TaxID=6604 RepID=UPI0022E68A56|nr:uncharacterized protein LOC128236597 [Mya arenaria]
MKHYILGRDAFLPAIVLLSVGFIAGNVEAQTCVDTSQECHVIGHDGVLSCKNVIPGNPAGATTVEIRLCVYMDIRRGAFVDRNWSFVEHLSFVWIAKTIDGQYMYFHSNWHEGLDVLLQLGLHLFQGEIGFDNDAFHGMSTLKSLDLSNWNYLDDNAVLRIFANNLSLQSVNELNLSNTYIHKFNKQFIQTVMSRPIKVLDLRHTTIKEFDRVIFSRHCHYLQYLYFSGVLERNPRGFGSSGTEQICTKLKIVDISNTEISKLSFGYHVSSLNVNYSENSSVFGRLRLIFDAETVKLDNNLKGGYSIGSGVVTINWTTSNTFLKWKNLYLRHNTLQTLNCSLIIPYSTFELLDLSNNILDYINPKLLSSLHSLRSLSLANNRLNDMLISFESDFVNLFAALLKLKNLDISNNNLQFFPADIFKHHVQLNQLDLSGNKITELSISICPLKYLTSLNISNNLLEVNDADLQKGITNYMEYCRNSSEKGPVFDITNNKIVCSSCEHKSTVEWLIYRKSYFYRWPELRCIGQSSRLLMINEDIVRSLNDACLRQTRIALATAIPFAFMLSLIGILYVLYKRRKASMRLQTRENRIAKLQADDDRFAVFLSYNSEDYNFVHEHVFMPLNLHLQTIVNTDRPLVCTGDQNFRLGLYIHEETIRLIQQSYVVVLMVTDSFCTSRFCQTSLSLL